MKVLETVAHWTFAVVVAIVVFFASLLLFAVSILKLEGLPIGVMPPADFHSRADPTILQTIVYCTTVLPLMAAAYCGAITAPYAQRGIASIVFPALVFSGDILLTYSGSHNHDFNFYHLARSSLVCAVVGLWLHYRWQRRRSMSAQTGR